jgi:F0F1-type ATP synthase assembly protein I
MAGQPNPTDPWSGMSVGWMVVSYLLGGLLTGMFAGWLIDKLVGTSKVFLAIGMLAGVAGGIYLIYLHFGKEHEDQER